MKQVKVIQYGLGAMGGNVVRLLSQKSSVRVVGAIDADEAKIGRDVGEVVGLKGKLGVVVDHPAEKVLDRVEADVVVHATTAFAKEALAQLTPVLKRRQHLVSICQELFFPLGPNLDRAAQIDQQARRAGVCVTSVGINPGFAMDIVPIVCSSPCWKVDSVLVRRIVDFSPYGPDEMKHIGAGLKPEEFDDGVEKDLIGHVGLLETAAMVAHCLGLEIDELRQTKKPLVSERARKTDFIHIEPGEVCGFKQNVVGLRGGDKILDFQMVGILRPDQKEDGLDLGDYTRINGQPNVDVTIKEEISQKGGLGTAGVAVNMIPVVLKAEPGFQTMNNLTLPRFWSGGGEPEPIQKITYF